MLLKRAHKKANKSNKPHKNHKNGNLVVVFHQKKVAQSNLLPRLTTVKINVWDQTLISSPFSLLLHNLLPSPFSLLLPDLLPPTFSFLPSPSHTQKSNQISRVSRNSGSRDILNFCGNKESRQ